MIKKIIVCAFLVTLVSPSAYAWPRRYRTSNSVPVTASPSAAYSNTGMAVSQGGLAQAKAEQQAAEGSCRHVGGGMGSGNYEGVGFSTVSAEHAISKCCYWGVLNPIDIGVARGPNGFHACVIYRR